MVPIMLGLDLRSDALERYLRVRSAKMPKIAGVQKECRSCGVSKAIGDFSIDRSKADGHRSDCKACRMASRKGKGPVSGTRAAELNARRAAEAAVPPGMRRCRACGKVKDLAEDFRLDRSCPGGHSLRCKPCASEKDARFRAANPESVRASRWAYDHTVQGRLRHALVAARKRLKTAVNRDRVAQTVAGIERELARMEENK